MKTLLMLTVIVLLGIQTSEAQVMVKVRPVAPVVVRPTCPSSHHVWVGGSWKWNRRMNNYEWVNGYWVRPRSHGAVWVDGYWRATRGG